MACRQIGRGEWGSAKGEGYQKPPPTIILLSGENGNAVKRVPLVNSAEEHLGAGEGQYFWIISLNTVGDVNGNGSSDIIVGSRGRVFIVDLVTGDLLWERIYGDESQSEKSWGWVEQGESVYLPIGDMNRDGIQDLVANTKEDKLTVLESHMDGELDFTPEGSVSVGGWLNREEIEILKDLNGDGSREVAFKVDYEGQNPEYMVMSPKIGEIIMKLNRPWEMSRSWGVGDFNGNGTEDSIISQMESEAGPRLSVYDSSEQIWSYQFDTRWVLESFGYRRTMPATSVGDINEDGKDELALAISSEWERGAKIDIYDVERGKIMKTITLEEFSQRAEKEVPGILAEQLSDLTGDNIPEMGVVVLLGNPNERHVSTFIVDPEQEEVLISYNSQPTDILSLKSGVGILGSDGSLEVIDPTKEVKLEEPKRKSPLHLEWISEGDYVTTVLADGTPVAMTTENSAEVRLPPGKHEITIRAVTPEGITTYDTLKVEVGGGSSLNLVIFGLTVVLFIILFLPNVLRRTRA